MPGTNRSYIDRKYIMNSITIPALLGCLGIFVSTYLVRDKSLRNKFRSKGCNQLIDIQARVRMYRKIFLIIMIMSPIILGMFVSIIPTKIVNAYISLLIMLIFLNVIVFGVLLKIDTYLEAEIKKRKMYSKESTK